MAAYVYTVVCATHLCAFSNPDEEPTHSTYVEARQERRDLRECPHCGKSDWIIYRAPTARKWKEVK